MENISTIVADFHSHHCETVGDSAWLGRRLNAVRKEMVRTTVKGKPNSKPYGYAQFVKDNIPDALRSKALKAMYSARFVSWCQVNGLTDELPVAEKVSTGVILALSDETDDSAPFKSGTASKADCMAILEPFRVLDAKKRSPLVDALLRQYGRTDVADKREADAKRAKHIQAYGRAVYALIAPEEGESTVSHKQVLLDALRGSEDLYNTFRELVAEVEADAQDQAAA